jgi:hypothetical protein
MLFWGVILLVILIALIHFMTTDKMTDGMGMASKEYEKFSRKRRGGGAVSDIPAPPDGKRDMEVEALLRRGDHKGARRLLEMRLDDARNAPIGRDAQIARVNHYMMLLRDL